MRFILDACPADYDASAFPFPFNSKAYDTASHFKKLSFGYCKTDGHVHITPPAARAIDETVEALKAAGHDGEPLYCPGTSKSLMLSIVSF